MFSEHHQVCQPLGKSAVAQLTAVVIDGLTCEELVGVIRAANLPPLSRPELQQRLPFYDHDTLRRLAYLARRCCRNQGF